MRFVKSGETVIYDETGLMEGRGYYLCKSEECVNEALKRNSFSRVCRCKMDSEDINRVANDALRGN